HLGVHGDATWPLGRPDAAIDAALGLCVHQAIVKRVVLVDLPAEKRCVELLQLLALGTGDDLPVDDRIGHFAIPPLFAAHRAPLAWAAYACPTDQWPLSARWSWEGSWCGLGGR